MGERPFEAESEHVLSRQSRAALQLSRTGCDFSMRLCSLGFSNQKATAFCAVGLLCLSQGSGQELACSGNLLCITLCPGSFRTSSSLSALPQTFQGCEKEVGRGRNRGK